ncbi:MAG: hypothetical protein HYY78_08940 [Betaproteobacteria bacterium]|nr:hypothetical protein [Betaproteobacteria bacterium]
MENVRNVEANAAAAQECCAPAAKSGWLNQRNLLIGVALAGGAGALVLGWDWLVAAGLASIIIAVAPCLVMCALGLCMQRTGKSEQATVGTPPPTPSPDALAVRAEAAIETSTPAPGNRA